MSDQVIVFAGISASEAVTVNDKFANSFVVLFPGLVTTGAWFTSFTVIVKPASLCAGVAALSVAVTVTG